MSQYVGPKTDAAHLATQGDLGGGGGSPEAWIEVGSSGAPSFQNSWTNDGGSGLETAGFYRHEGRVYLKGRIKNGTVNAAAFTLPPGYRPAAFVDQAIVSNFAFGRLTVGSNGAVSVALGSNTWASLSGVSFRVA